MAEIVTEQFKQYLFSLPSGERKTQPTIFDELRWAMQHVQNPLEQVLQLISEFHGLWTGMTPTLMNFVSQISSLANNNSSSAYISAAKSALATLNQLNLGSKVGRVNTITANTMPVELLRQFVARCQCMHPAVNTYIQTNIGKYPYFQQISESVCHFGQVVLNKTDVSPIKRSEPNGDVNMDTDFRLRRNTNVKLFDTIKPIVDVSTCLLNTMFIRSMSMDNNMSLLHQEYENESPIAHGHSFTMDVFNAKRTKAAIQPCIMESAKKFGPTLQLCNWAFPVEQQIQKQPQWFTLQAETGSYVADELNRPIPREPKIPIASPEDKQEKV